MNIPCTIVINTKLIFATRITCNKWNIRSALRKLYFVINFLILYNETLRLILKIYSNWSRAQPTSTIASANTFCFIKVSGTQHVSGNNNVGVLADLSVRVGFGTLFI